jgi:putative hydrolase of the HAD superfamily
MGGTIQSYRYTRDLRIKNAPLIQDCLLKGGIHLSLDDEMLADIITRGMDAYHKWNRESLIELNPTEVWKDWVLKGYSVQEEAISPIAEELSYLYETRFYIREMRPEMPVVLEKIKAMGLRIGLISNTQSLRQVPSNLKEYGIDHYFSPIILSSEYGRRKPDPSIFYYAARMANVPTGSCVYIGDKVNRDILGSKRAGFNLAIQIIHQYNNGEPDEGASPDAVIQSMTELIPYLERALQAGNNKSQRGAAGEYKALFFDAGDILYSRPNSGKNLRKFLKDKAIKRHPDLEKERARLKSMAFEDQICRHEYYKKIIQLFGIEDPELVAQGVQAMNKDDLTVEILEGVKDTLLSLKEMGYILGIITDTALPIQIKLGWFEEHGFGHIWDTVVSSREIRARKPSPRIYQEAVQQIGLKPEETIFVGHKTSELIGAHSYGMRTIAFNYDKDAPADIYIQKFSDLLQIPIVNNSNGREQKDRHD